VTRSTTSVVITATVDGESFVRKVLNDLPEFDSDLRICEHLTARNFAFKPKIADLEEPQRF
jgi:hypothetical protein